jgi:hypothetical protein
MAVSFFSAVFVCAFAATAHAQGASKDVNGDGRTDASDIQLVVNASLGLPVDFNADINGDQRIDAADIQITIAIALGTTEDLFPGGYALKIFDQGTYGDLVGVGIFLVRGTDVRPNDPAPISIALEIVFDDAAFEPVSQFYNGVVTSPGELLGDWYQHTMWASSSDSDTIYTVITGQSEITTFDDQFPSTRLREHDPTRQENPLLLGTFFLRKLPGATGQSEMTFRWADAYDENGDRLLEFSSEGGVFTLDPAGL